MGHTESIRERPDAQSSVGELGQYLGPRRVRQRLE